MAEGVLVELRGLRVEAAGSVLACQAPPQLRNRRACLAVARARLPARAAICGAACQPVVGAPAIVQVSLERRPGLLKVRQGYLGCAGLQCDPALLQRALSRRRQVAKPLEERARLLVAQIGSL